MRKFFLISLLSVFIFSAAPAHAAKVVVNKVVAIVNSEPILQSDVKAFTKRLRQEGGVDESLIFEEAPLKVLKSNSKQQLEYLIREKMILSEVKKLNLTVSEDRLDSEVNSLAKRNQMTKAQFVEFIRKQGYSLNEYRQNLKSRLERQSFYEAEVISKLRITDEDALNEFRQKNPNYVPSLNEYTISQIFVPAKNIGPKAAMDRAVLLKQRMNSGESFEAVANAYNAGTSAAKDGFLGTFKAGEFNQEIENEVAALSEGGVSEPIKSRQGVHIVKVINKKNTQDPQFLRIKDQIKSYLVEKNFKRQLKNWFESKKQETHIQIL